MQKTTKTLIFSVILAATAMFSTASAGRSMLEGNCYLRKEYNYFMDQWTTNEVCEPRGYDVYAPSEGSGWGAINRKSADVEYINTPSRPAFNYNNNTSNKNCYYCEGGAGNNYNSNNRNIYSAAGISAGDYYAQFAWNKGNNINLSGYTTPYSYYNNATFYHPQEGYNFGGSNFRWSDVARSPWDKNNSFWNNFNRNSYSYYSPSSLWFDFSF